MKEEPKICLTENRCIGLHYLTDYDMCKVAYKMVLCSNRAKRDVLLF